MLCIINFLLYHVFLLKILLLMMAQSGKYAIEHNFRYKRYLKEASAFSHDHFPSKILYMITHIEVYKIYIYKQKCIDNKSCNVFSNKSLIYIVLHFIKNEKEIAFKNINVLIYFHIKN